MHIDILYILIYENILFVFMSTIASSHRQMIRKFLCCMSTMVLWKKLEAHWRFVSKLYFYLSMFSIYILGFAHYRRRGGYSMLQWHELGKSCTSCMLQLTLTVRQAIYCTMLNFKQYHFFELTLLIQLLQPSRFLREIPVHLLEVQVSNTIGSSFTKSNPYLKTQPVGERPSPRYCLEEETSVLNYFVNWKLFFRW